MITEWDDLLIHQIISTMDHVESSDPRWHGSYRGKLVVEGDKFDLTDEQELARLVYANDYFAEWRCDDGEVGYGQFEYLMGASDRFGFPRN